MRKKRRSEKRNRWHQPKPPSLILLIRLLFATSHPRTSNTSLPGQICLTTLLPSNLQTLDRVRRRRSGRRSRCAASTAHLLKAASEILDTSCVLDSPAVVVVVAAAAVAVISVLSSYGQYAVPVHIRINDAEFRFRNRKHDLHNPPLNRSFDIPVRLASWCARPTSTLTSSSSSWHTQLLPPDRRFSRRRQPLLTPHIDKQIRTPFSPLLPRAFPLRHGNVFRCAPIIARRATPSWIRFIFQPILFPSSVSPETSIRGSSLWCRRRCRHAFPVNRRRRLLDGIVSVRLLLHILIVHCRSSHTPRPLSTAHTPRQHSPHASQPAHPSFPGSWTGNGRKVH
jgi:hypothetical protein